MKGKAKKNCKKKKTYRAKSKRNELTKNLKSIVDKTQKVTLWQNPKKQILTTQIMTKLKTYVKSN